jgi:nucleoside-diphosphate-sugar epimerase
MTRPTAIITGAAGFLGSAMTTDLAGDFAFVAIDNREPSADLAAACPEVAWHRVDVADGGAVDAVFRDATKLLKRVDFVIHFAAFWHFGGDVRPEYDATNVRGTENILCAARAIEAKRLVFASSVAALEGSAERRVSEKSLAVGGTPYGRSKMIGERIVSEADGPAIILRIGGVFTEWCELPPLWSVIQSWGQRGLSGRAVPGSGRSAIPYIHRDDLVALARAAQSAIHQ